MTYTIYELLCFFVIYSVLGWCLEVCFCTCLLYTSRMCIRDRHNAQRAGHGAHQCRHRGLDAFHNGHHGHAPGQAELQSDIPSQVERDVAVIPVSYTHLDVYKRQPYSGAGTGGASASVSLGGEWDAQTRLAIETLVTLLLEKLH